VLTVSFAHTYPLPSGAVETLAAEYAGAATVANEPELGYQVTLQV